jgi:hypothetical protein
MYNMSVYTDESIGFNASIRSIIYCSWFVCLATLPVTQLHKVDLQIKEFAL